MTGVVEEQIKPLKVKVKGKGKKIKKTIPEFKIIYTTQDIFLYI